MRFETKEQRDSLIESFKQEAKTLTENNPKKTDSLIQIDHCFEYDDEVPFDDITGQAITDTVCKGELYKIVIKQPSFLDFAKILDLGGIKACVLAIDTMIDFKLSSPEVSEDRFKRGYFKKILTFIDAASSGQKKRK